MGLLGKPSLAIVSPRDLCRFLVFKDRGGKTQVHRNGWAFLGQRGTHSCGCPVRLSYKTVDSYTGKLRSIFHAIGRDGEWDRRLSFKCVFFSGDRLGDLGRLKVPEILRFPNDDGFLFNHVWGKTLRDGDENVFGIRRNPQLAICPI